MPKLNPPYLFQTFFAASLVLFFCFLNSQGVILFEDFRYTQKFLGCVAPVVILICLSLGGGHYVVNKYWGTLFKESGVGFSRRVIGLSFFFGCTNLLLLIKGEKVRLSFSERYILLSICFGSAGGLTCLSLSTLGFPIYQLVITSLFLPVYILFVCYLMTWSSRTNLSLRREYPKIIPLRISLRSYLSKYWLGSSKLVVNKAIVVMLFEVVQKIAIERNIDWSIFTYYPAEILLKAGFTVDTSLIIAEAWLAKTFANRDLAMIYLSGTDVFGQLTLLQQLFTLPMLINIVSISSVIIITLNILALFGRNGIQFIKVLPVALLTAFVSPIIPIVLISFW